MLRFVARRLAMSAFVLLLVIFLILVLQELTPGDPAATVAGDSASPEVLAGIRAELGLDEPLIQRYLTYLADLLRGDLGTSLQTQQPVAMLIASAIPATASITLLALVFTVLIAPWAGLVSAVRRDRFSDRAVVFGSAVGLAAPPFVIALLLQTLVSLQWGLLPATGYIPFSGSPMGWLQSIILPALVLSVASIAELTRQFRGALIDTFEQDFIRTTRSKGLKESAVVFRHAFRNSATPAVTVLGMQVSRIVGGAVIVESVFAIPGLGLLGYTAIVNHDYLVVQGVVLVGAIAVILSNLTVDIINGYINPRTRVS